MILTMLYVDPGLTWGRIFSACVISMWSNDIKCKYMFIFPLKNLARKELLTHCLNLRGHKSHDYLDCFMFLTVFTVSCRAQHSLVDPFWRSLEGFSIPLFRISLPWSQTSPGRGLSKPIKPTGQALTLISPWLTLSTKDITTSFWH